MKDEPETGLAFHSWLPSFWARFGGQELAAGAAKAATAAVIVNWSHKLYAN